MNAGAAGGLSWRDRALCAGTDPEVFFPGRGDRVRGRDAQRLCGGCPVRADCLAFALASDQRFGIWGGLSETQRRPLRRLAACR